MVATVSEIREHWGDTRCWLSRGSKPNCRDCHVKKKKATIVRDLRKSQYSRFMIFDKIFQLSEPWKNRLSGCLPLSYNNYYSWKSFYMPKNNSVILYNKKCYWNWLFYKIEKINWFSLINCLLDYPHNCFSDSVLVVWHNEQSEPQDPENTAIVTEKTAKETCLPPSAGKGKRSGLWILWNYLDRRS